MEDCEKCGFSRSKSTFITNLQLRLQYEKFKNKIFENIIHTFTSIKVTDIISESKNEINVYNFSNGNIPIIVNDFIQGSQPPDKIVSDNKASDNIPPTNTDSKKYMIEAPPKKPKKFRRKHLTHENPSMSENEIIIEDDDEPASSHPLSVIIDENPPAAKPQKFRKVPEYVKTSEKELDTKLKEDAAVVEKKLEEIVYNNFDVSHKEITDNIENLFVQIQTTRTHAIHLTNMKNTRRKLLGKLNLTEYTELLLSHIKRLEEIFARKNHSRKKINQIIQTSLTPLDTRLVYYEGYTNIIMDVDEVEKFNLVLSVLVHHEKQFVPYDKKLFYDNIKNYGLALFELSDCIEKCLINIFGFYNVIYLNRNKGKAGDPYSFYVLTSVKDNRFWKMECRLEDFTNEFIDNILPYCISLFRRIYKDVFADNMYRKDYMTKSQIMEFDCEQLIKNIITLAKPNSLCRTFQNIIKDNCTFTSTETDKFNLYGDDKLQQKRFSTLADTEEDVCKVLKSVFDELNSDEASKLLYSKTTN